MNNLNKNAQKPKLGQSYVRYSPNRSLRENRFERPSHSPYNRRHSRYDRTESDIEKNPLIESVRNSYELNNKYTYENITR